MLAIEQFLTRDVKKRLGCGKNARKDIENHAFFKETDWGKMQRMEVPPPYVPPSKGKDASNFDPEFTGKDVALTPADPKFIAEIDQGDFAGFTYVACATASAAAHHLQVHQPDLLARSVVCNSVESRVRLPCFGMDMIEQNSRASKMSLIHIFPRASTQCRPRRRRRSSDWAPH